MHLHDMHESAPSNLEALDCRPRFKIVYLAVNNL